MKEITQKQAEILNFIIKFKEDNDGMVPTYREIGANQKITIKGVSDHLSALKKKGYIDWISNSGRSLKILKKPENAA